MGRTSISDPADLSPAPEASDYRHAPRVRRLCNLDRLLGAMEARGLDGIVSYYAPNVFYLSGYATRRLQVHEANGYGSVVISRHEPEHPIVIVPDFEVHYFISHPTWVEDVRPYRSLFLPLDRPWDRAAIDLFLPAATREIPWVKLAREHYAEDMLAATLRAMEDIGLRRGRVGFDNPWLARHVEGRFEPHLTVSDAYGLMKYVRQVKTAEELVLLRRATQLNQQIQEKVVREWKRGMTWREVEMAYYQEALRLGGVIPDRDTMIWANPKGADPALVLSSRPEDDYVLEAGMSIMFDSHGIWNNYNWDGGKTWFIEDEPKGIAGRAARACADAMEDLVAAMRPGVAISRLQTVGRRAYELHQLPRIDTALVYFHGLGIENSDRESAFGNASEFDWQLEEGMVVAAHVVYPGDDRTRCYIEEIGVVRRDGLDRFFTWDFQPLRND